MILPIFFLHVLVAGHQIVWKLIHCGKKCAKLWFQARAPLTGIQYLAGRKMQNYRNERNDDLTSTASLGFCSIPRYAVAGIDDLQ
jgi:hypothetical protein